MIWRDMHWLQQINTDSLMKKEQLFVYFSMTILKYLLPSR